MHRSVRNLTSSLTVSCQDNIEINTAETAVNALNFDTSGEFGEVMEKLMAFLWK